MLNASDKIKSLYSHKLNAKMWATVLLQVFLCEIMSRYSHT